MLGSAADLIPDTQLLIVCTNIGFYQIKICLAAAEAFLWGLQQKSVPQPLSYFVLIKCIEFNVLRSLGVAT